MVALAPIDGVVLFAYAWLLVELLFYAVPSEASVYQLLTSESGDERSSAVDDRLARARRRPAVTKFLLYFLPTAIGVLCFLAPLVAVFWRDVLIPLVPLPWLAHPWMLWVGAAGILGGRLLTFWSVLQIRKRHRRRDLQPSGLFAWSRNPGLLGMYAFYLGNCLVFPCVGLFAGFVPYVWNMHREC